MTPTRLITLGMIVSSSNGDFTLTFIEEEGVRIHRNGECVIQLFETEVEPLFSAIMEGFSLITLKKVPDVITDLSGTLTKPIYTEPLVTEAEKKMRMLKDIRQFPTSLADPAPLPPPGHEDDPHYGYIIRHEFKDLYFSEADMSSENRHCSGDKSSSFVFATNYAAIRFTQAMKHPIDVIRIETSHIVSWKVSDNDVTHYCDGTISGTLHKAKALRMGMAQASRIAETLPGQFIILVEKVQV